MNTNKTIGNYTRQVQFPLDEETLLVLQENQALLELLGNIAGDKVILSGCELTGGTTRAPGYVFLKTKEYPTGEVLRYEGGNSTSGMYLATKDIDVNANNVEYNGAYTQRWLAVGLGSENYTWDGFTPLRSTMELKVQCDDLQSQIDSLKPAPFGIVEMWAGTVVPDGYALCNGGELAVADYPGLYGAIGSTFNSAKDRNGSPYTTQPGKFRLPDLRGRFVVGYDDSDAEYNRYGNAGGEKKHQLKSNELPKTDITVKDYCQLPNGSGEITTGNITIGGKSVKAGGDSVSGMGKRAQTSGSNGAIQWIEHGAGSFGEDGLHENRPPYYALAYIMRTT